MYPVPYKNAKDIPYLAAIISEALRVHPPVGSMLERVVPTEGLRLPDGRFLPPGTLVGMNAWVLNADKAIYGPDADQFVPERWLPRDGETAAEWEDRKRKMRETDLTFGAGKRVCLGKNVGVAEVYKLTATLFSLYKVSVEFRSNAGRIPVQFSPLGFFLLRAVTNRMAFVCRGCLDGVRGSQQRMAGHEHVDGVSVRDENQIQTCPASFVK